MNIDNKLISKEFIYYLNFIADSLGELMVFVDRQGIIKMISREYAKFLGIARNEALGQYVGDVIENTRMDQVLLSGKKEQAELQFIQGQNMVATRIPLVVHGEIVGALGKVLFKDTEELSQLYEKIHNMEEELDRYKNAIQHTAKYDLDSIITEDETMKEMKRRVKEVAMTNSNVLILGESGTGKELFAHAIYKNSKRSDRPFIKVNCSAIPYELIESELFGYEEGSFTGGRKGGKMGKFEAADGGIIFLDEIGELPLNMQSKLLRVIQEKEIEKIGALSSKKVDVRIIAATNRDLESMVEEGTFRLDLYYRLNVVNIEIPALRERVNDIDLLSYHLIRKLSRSEDIFVEGIARETLNYFKAYSWPGNVRELENIIERAINFLGDDTIIRPEHLPPKLLEELTGGSINQLRDSLEEVEKREIKRSLAITKGNKARAAKALGISRTNLYEKMEKYKID